MVSRCVTGRPVAFADPLTGWFTSKDNGSRVGAVDYGHQSHPHLLAGALHQIIPGSIAAESGSVSDRTYRGHLSHTRPRPTTLGPLHAAPVGLSHSQTNGSRDHLAPIEPESPLLKR